MMKISTVLTGNSNVVVRSTVNLKKRLVHTATANSATADKGDVLFLSSSLLPEPNASAAGVRTMALLQNFLHDHTNSNIFDNVHYGYGCAPTTTDTDIDIDTVDSSKSGNININININMNQKYSFSESLHQGIHFHHIPINRSSMIQDYLSSTASAPTTSCTNNYTFNTNNNNNNNNKKKNNYDNNNDSIVSKEITNLKAVIFDRFFSEEAYSFHFQKSHPHVLRVLDMQDMHSLRMHRQNIVQSFDSYIRQHCHKFNTLQYSKLPSASITKSIFQNIDPNTIIQNDQTLMEYLVHSIPTTSLPSLYNNNNPSRQNKYTVNNILLRELASIHRSDLTIVCSPYEMDLLIHEYNIPQQKLVLGSFFTPLEEEEESLSLPLPALPTDNHTNHDNYAKNSSNTFHSRQHFVSLGGFKHPPNIDQVLTLKYDIWPKIKSSPLLLLQPNNSPSSSSSQQQSNHHNLVPPQLHIYGSYPPLHVQKLHDPKSGFIVKGYMNDLNMLSCYRVLLSPLRFGAGIKGKIVDAWRFGTPVVTTPVGSEGMSDTTTTTRNRNSTTCSNHDTYSWWGGLIANDSESFVQNAIDLYQNEKLWFQSSSKAKFLLKTLYNPQHNFSILNHAIQNALHNLSQRREKDYVSSLLWHQTLRSTEYFSKWIECKETNKPSSSIQ